MIDSYLSIAAPVRAEIRVERSRFIASAVPISSRVAAEEEYDRIRREYHDATHNCLAYVVGRDADAVFRFSDDGEPSGTAGKQIYDSIRTRNLTNVLIVVTRYFGGIKLGTGGLGRAYREAANAALDQAAVVERFAMQTCRLTFAHDQTSAVMKVTSDFGVKPTATEYREQVELTVTIRLGSFEPFRLALIDRTHGKVIIELTGVDQ